MSMKLIGIVLAVVVLGGAGAYFVMNPGVSGMSANTPTAESDAKDMPSEGTFSGSLADLIGRGGNWQCTFNVESGVANSSGTVFISGEKLRGDFASVVPQLNQTIDSHMIQSEGYVYVWTSLAPQGFKAKTTIGTPDGTTAFQGQGINIDQQYNYNCTAWVADSSKFELPSGVTFAGS
ncbi:hypothetical protein K2P56_02760 [Patescibacteria group bacterium]|nr:hypothetical protein [Patescibacteria group bacterium]